MKYYTIPNVLLNVKYENASENSQLESIKSHCKFYSGDWSSFLRVTDNDFKSENEKFDFIFTCETIYNAHNYAKLCEVFKKRLKRNGIVYPLLSKDFSVFNIIIF